MPALLAKSGPVLYPLFSRTLSSQTQNVWHQTMANLQRDEPIGMYQSITSLIGPMKAVAKNVYFTTSKPEHYQQLDAVFATPRRIASQASAVDKAVSALIAERLAADPTQGVSFLLDENVIIVCLFAQLNMFENLLDTSRFTSALSPQVQLAADQSKGVCYEWNQTTTGSIQSILIQPSGLPNFQTTSCSFSAWIKLSEYNASHTELDLFDSGYFRITLGRAKQVSDPYTGTLVDRVIIGVSNIKYLGIAKDYRYTIPVNVMDSKHSQNAKMHECPALGEWFFLCVTSNAEDHFNVVLNSVQYSFYHTGVLNAPPANFSPQIVKGGDANTLKLAICNFHLARREITPLEISALYREFLKKNDPSALANLPVVLDRIRVYVGKSAPSLQEHQQFDTDVQTFCKTSMVSLHDETGEMFQKVVQVINAFDASPNGPLFHPDNQKRGFHPRLHEHGASTVAEHTNGQLNTHRAARGMLLLQQRLFDVGVQLPTPYRFYFFSRDLGSPRCSIPWCSHAEKNAMTNLVFKTASYFPGIPSSSVPVQTRSAQIKAQNRRIPGIPVDYWNEYVVRSTGCWVRQGHPSEVTVPASIVNKGYILMVGAHRNDPSLVQGGHPTGLHTRMDRISTYFAVDQTKVTVFSPFGGGLYLLVPFLADHGVVTVSATNILSAPFYRDVQMTDTTRAKTTQAEWEAAIVNGCPPWVDIETDHFMLHVPLPWIQHLVSQYQWLTSGRTFSSLYERIEHLTNQWNVACKACAKLRDIDVLEKERDRPVLYCAIDATMRTSAGGVGWPMSNVVYKPATQTEGSVNFFLIWPFEDTTTWHELGHNLYTGKIMFRNGGETENELNYIYMCNQYGGYTLDSSFQSVRKSPNTTLNDAVVDWMREDVFRSGGFMRYRLAGYLPRSWHKYMDIVRLWGWDALIAICKYENKEYNEGRIHTTNTEADDQKFIVRICKAVGADVAPLMDFWGITSTEATGQDTFRTTVRSQVDAVMGTIGHGGRAVHKCRGVRAVLLHFKSLIPTNDAAMQSVLKRIYTGFTEGSPPAFSVSSPSDRDLGSVYKFYITDNRTWSGSVITESQNRIDAILSAHGLTAEPPVHAACEACVRNGMVDPTPVTHPIFADKTFTPSYTVQQSRLV